MFPPPPRTSLCTARTFSICRVLQCTSRIHPQSTFPILRASPELLHPQSTPRTFLILRHGMSSSGWMCWGLEQQDGGKTHVWPWCPNPPSVGGSGQHFPAGTRPWRGAHVQPPRSVTQIPAAAAHPTPASSQAVLEAEPLAPAAEGVWEICLTLFVSSTASLTPMPEVWFWGGTSFCPSC